MAQTSAVLLCNGFWLRAARKSESVMTPRGALFPDRPAGSGWR
jgi:hypothetical protein